MMGLIDEIIRILNQPADYLPSITQRRQLLQKLGQLWHNLPTAPPEIMLPPQAEEENYVDLQIEVIAKITEILWLLWDSPLWEAAAAQRSWQDFLAHYRQFVAAQIATFWQLHQESIPSEISQIRVLPSSALSSIVYDLHQQLGMAFFKRGLWTGAVFGFELAWLGLAPMPIFQLLTAADFNPKVDLDLLTPLLKSLTNTASACSDGSYPQVDQVPENTKQPNLDLACGLLCNLGAAWAMQATDASLRQAIRYYHQALILDPDLVPAHFNLGAAYFRLEEWDAAIAHLETALRLKPDYAEACTKLGAVLVNRQQAGDLAQAIAYHEKAIQLCLTIAASPQGYGIADAYYNLAVAQTQNHQPQAAISAYEKAIFHRPDFADAHTNLSMLLLAQGDLSRGWPEYEWRWQTNHLDLPMTMECPRWQGEDLQGKVIFLFTEQGFGDGIQFCRYVPLVAARGARVILQCQPELKRLFNGLAGVTWLVTAEEPIPEFDYYAPLMSLPLIFGTTLANIPNTVPYLVAPLALPLQTRFETETDPQLLASLSRCFPKPLQIGLVWSSSAKGNLHYQKFQGEKSLDLDLLLQAMDLSQTRVYTLQVGPETAILEPPPGQTASKFITEHLLTERLIPLHPFITDFADTAGFISQLDLIITIDTAVAHLAGALGKPTWVLLAYHSDWRWLGNRDGASADDLTNKYQTYSPWYPTMRLFRQTIPYDWGSVIIDLQEALLALHHSQSQN